MKDNIPKQFTSGPKRTTVRQTPPRVAARLEGVVKNHGVQKTRKPKRRD